MPGAARQTAGVADSSARSESWSLSRLRAIATASRPRRPEPPSSTASSSASESDWAPLVSNFSRGRSRSGQSLILIRTPVGRRSGATLKCAPSLMGHSPRVRSSYRARIAGKTDNQRMKGKRILLGVTGGIAAYKSADLVRRLREHGAQVQVVMTAGAREFVTPTTFQALSGRPVRSDLWDAAHEAAMGHIELARWAELLLVAPASADFLARLAHGLADDLLSTLALATSAPIAVAPAMNHLMWSNAATQANVALLQQRGVRVLGPGVGDQACGETGAGRMLEPLEITAAIAPLLRQEGPLTGPRVLVAGGA